MTEKQKHISTERLYAKVVILINKSTKAYHKALKDGNWGLWEKKAGRAQAARKKFRIHLCQTGEDNRRYSV